MSSSLGDDGRYLFQGVHDRGNRAACYPDPDLNGRSTYGRLETRPRLDHFCGTWSSGLCRAVSVARAGVPALVHSYPWGFGRSFSVNEASTRISRHISSTDVGVSAWLAVCRSCVVVSATFPGVLRGRWHV